MKNSRFSLPAPRAAQGFTIVELLIAMTIGLILVGVVGAVLMGSLTTTKSRERESDIQVNGRYAVETVRRSLNHAGFLGVSSLFWPDDPYTATAVTNVCDSTMIAKLSRRISASNNANPYSATCIPTANYRANTDVLVVRHLSTNPVAGPYTSAAPAAANFNAPYTAFDANTLYYHAAYEGGTIFKGNAGPPDFSGSSKQPPYFDYMVEEYVYYISPWTNSVGESPQVPALYRLRLSASGGAPAMVPELVASGVENLQVRLAQIGMSSSGTYHDATGVTDWDAVQAIEVSLLVRGQTADSKLTGAQTYTLAGTSLSFSDGFPRQVYSMVIQMRN